MRAPLLVVFALPLAAQSLPSPTLAPDVILPIHTVPADPIGGGGGTFAAGADYKVRFGETMEFTPYLGASYPHNQPFAWRTTRITIGDAMLPLHGAQGTVESATRFRYDLGACLETYEVRLEGLEQTFTFAARPGEGDLRIRGIVGTQLVATDGDRGHANVSFFDREGAAIVGFGACTAEDAAGRRFPMRTLVAGNSIELVLGAADVAAAAWPLVVDPLLTNVLLSTSATLPLGQPRVTDVARDDENNQLMIAIQRHASATDEDLFLRLHTDGFAGSLGLVFADTDTTWDSTDAKVTFVGGADRWVAAFTRAFDSTGTKAVRWHPHIAASTALDTTIGFLTPAAGSSDLRPAVGGYAAFTAEPWAVLAWQRDLNLGAGGTHTNDPNSQIWLTRIDVTGTAGGGGPGAAAPAVEITGTDPAGQCDRERPTMNKESSGTTTSDFLIAFQTYWNTAPGGVDDWDVEGRRIDGTGAFLPGVWVASSNFPNNDHKLGPIVDGWNDEYVVSYTLADNTAIPFKTLAIEGSRVAIESYDFAAPAIGAPQVVANTGFVKSLVVTGLAYDTLTRSHAVVVHHDILPHSVHATKVGFHNRIVEAFTAYSTAGHVGIGGGACFDDDADRFAFVFGVEDGAQQPVYGNLVTYVATPAPTTYGAAGCSGGSIAWSSYHRIGHEHGALILTGAAPGRIALALASLAPANAPLAALGYGSCTLLVDLLAPNYITAFAAITSVGGFAEVGIPIDESLPPFLCYFQWFVLDGPTTNTTNTAGLSVTFDR